MKRGAPALDRFRLLAAVLVVAIHTSPLTTYTALGDFYLTRVLGRVAVPFFLMVSGYFLAEKGWRTEDSDPLRLTLAAPAGMTGAALAERLREHGIECEYADRDFLVGMVTPENVPADLDRLEAALGTAPAPPPAPPALPLARGAQVCSIRQAAFAPRETVPAEQALGRICSLPTVGCPPAIPIAVSGERITPEAVELFRAYGVEQVEVLK